MSIGARRLGPGADGSPARADGVGAAAAVGKRTLVEGRGPVQRSAHERAGEAPTAIRAAAAHGLSGAAVGLPHRDTIQRAFGRHDVSAIRAHVGGPAAQGAAQLGAQAYATGEQVAFAGPPDLHTAAHEVAHVVQQRAGVALADGVGQRGDAYEQRADAVADRVVAGESAEALLGDAPAGGAAAGHAVQRKVTVGDEARSYEELEPVVEQPRERLVLHAMVQEESTTYPFATPEELGRFVVNVAKTDWGPSPVDGEDPGARVATFATSQVGKHVWASDNRTGLYGQQELRVTRTNTLTKQFLRDKKLAKLEDNAHSLVGTVGNGAKLKQHVYSAMMTSLSPAASDEDRRQANDHVKPRAEQGHPGSVMNCEQFVAYSLWGGGVIQDWELALIFAACAQEGAMAFLYRAMGLDAATLVTPVTVPSELPQDPSTTTPEQRSLGLDEVSVLFEINGELRDPKKVAHMLLYVGNGTIVELNASNVSPEQWRASAYPETTYLQRDFATKRKSLFACPVSAVPAQLQSTLAEIVLAYPGERLLAPKQIDTEVTNEHRAYGFLPFVQRGQL